MELIQIALLLSMAIWFEGVNIHWLWLPVVWILEVILVVCVPQLDVTVVLSY